MTRGALAGWAASVIDYGGGFGRCRYGNTPISCHRLWFWVAAEGIYEISRMPRLRVRRSLARGWTRWGERLTRLFPVVDWSSAPLLSASPSGSGASRPARRCLAAVPQLDRERGVTGEGSDQEGDREGSDDGKGKLGKEEMKLVAAVSGAEYVPMYEGMDGDWMLVGDVLWRCGCAPTGALTVCSMACRSCSPATTPTMCAPVLFSAIHEGLLKEVSESSDWMSVYQTCVRLPYFLLQYWARKVGPS